MKLYILRPVKPWSPWYDSAFGFVIRAETEEQARSLAACESGAEGEAVWTNPAATTCEELTAQGLPEVVMRDFASG